MIYRFTEPKLTVVEFVPYPGGGCRNPLKIPYCTEVIARKIVAVTSIAKDGRKHRHKYNRHIIARITCDSEILYSAM